MRRGKRGLREQTEIVDNVDKSVQNSIFPKKGKKWVCKTYPQNWGQNVDNVDNKKVEHIFCATCLVYHKVGGLAEEKTFYLDRQGGGVLQQVPLFVYGGSCFMAGIFRVRQVRLIFSRARAQHKCKKIMKSLNKIPVSVRINKIV